MRPAPAFWISALLLAALVTLGDLEVRATQSEGSVLFERAGSVHPDLAKSAGLEQRWLTRAPLDPGVDFLELLHVHEGRLFAATAQGRIFALDPSTGLILWSIRVQGPVHRPRCRLSFDSRRLFVAMTDRILVLDRDSGNTLESLEVPAPLASEVAVSPELICAPLHDSFVHVFRLPYTGASRNESAPLSNLTDHVPALPPNATRRTEKLHTFRLDEPLQAKPIMAGLFFIAPMRNHRLATIEPVSRKLIGEFALNSPVASPVVYAPKSGAVLVATADHQVYSLGLAPGTLPIYWRAHIGAEIDGGLVVNGLSVYAVSRRAGLTQLNLTSGNILWTQPACQQFLAANERYVYGLDRHHNLLVLGKKDGTLVHQLRLTGYTLVAHNSVGTDIYVASRDGSMLCLRPRE